MWWDRSEPFEVYLSDRAVGFGATAAQPGLWAGSSGLDDSLQQLVVRLCTVATPELRRIRVWLGGSLARPFLVPATSGARNQNEALALATAIAPDSTGIDGPVRLWLDRWHAGAPTLAVAVQTGVWDDLHATVTACNASRKVGLRRRRSPTIAIASVRPWWNLLLDELLPESRADSTRLGWSLSEGAGTLHGIIDRGALVEIGYDRPGPHDPSGDMLRRRLQVNWGMATMARHLFFEQQASDTGTRTSPIGAWRQAAGSVA